MNKHKIFCLRKLSSDLSVFDLSKSAAEAGLNTRRNSKYSWARPFVQILLQDGLIKKSGFKTPHRAILYKITPDGEEILKQHEAHNG